MVLFAKKMNSIFKESAMRENIVFFYTCRMCVGLYLHVMDLNYNLLGV